MHFGKTQLVFLLSNAGLPLADYTVASYRRYGPMFEFIVNHNLTALFGFSWVSQIMSAIIASERCFCVVSPLRSQSILSTRTMAVIIVVVFIVVTGLYFVVAFRYRMMCAYDPATGVYFKMVDWAEFYYKHKVIIRKKGEQSFGHLSFLFFFVFF